MTDAAASWRSRVRLALAAILLLSIVAFALQLSMVRPFLWPAGAGLTLSGDSVLVTFGAPRAIPRTRPPDISAATPQVVVVDVRPTSEAAQAGLSLQARVTSIQSDGGYLVDLAQGLPPDAAALLTRWRDAYWLGPRGPIMLGVEAAGAVREIRLERWAVWQVDAATRGDWLRAHGGALVQMAALLAGALALLVLGTRGMTATLMMLALVLTAVANGGLLLGAERSVPLARELLVLFGWLATPLAFPVIGFAVLYFPSKAPVLERHRWIAPALAAAAAPMFVISFLASLFLLGADGVLPLLAWLSTHAWVYDTSFAVALGANVLIVIEGIGRYQTNLDQNERRRIQLIVFTGVPAVFAYAIRVFVPLLSSLAGRPIELHWFIESILTVLVVLPALALPYAVAVRHVFSPRTVLRRGLQYALARRTLSILILLPIAALVISLVAGRERPLADIVLGQPFFFVISVALAALGLRYRDAAQQWLDQRFFRAEYDAREILVSLASRVPYETDPRELVAMVLTQIDSALHPESVAVLAGDGDRLEVVAALRCSVEPLPREDALVTLLRWSDEPLEVFLDDERSPAARLPHGDRQWLQKSHATLLVPIFTGTGPPSLLAQRNANSGEAGPPSLAAQRNPSSGEAGQRLLVGIVVLGAKRSEEPYTAEDRRLLSGIATQMSVALDLSRLRRTAAAAGDDPPADYFRQGSGGRDAESVASRTPTRLFDGPARVGAALFACPQCQRCFDAAAFGPGSVARCPDDHEVLLAVAGMPPVVDGKYRVDGVVGKGGMGAVFRARDLRLDRDIAIKIVRADLVADPEARARFRREAQIVARLQHPAVVTVFDYGNLADGAAFLVMEFIRGEDLRSVLRRELTLSRERTIELMTGVAMGVEAAHQAGVLHRDLKPENVLLPANGAGPKVLDFGVAKITDASAADGTVTQGATIIGTPAYMSPEQLRGDVLDGRSDVYSLGVMTYELLTGGLPFGMGSFIDVGIQQAGGAAGIDTTRVPGALTAVILRALSADRNARPSTPAAFAAELRTKN